MTKKVDEQEFQNLRSELDQIINDLQTGNVGIEEAMTRYERGQEIINQLEKFLEQTENKIIKLTAQTSSNDME